MATAAAQVLALGRACGDAKVKLGGRWGGGGKGVMRGTGTTAWPPPQAKARGYIEAQGVGRRGGWTTGSRGRENHSKAATAG